MVTQSTTYLQPGDILPLDGPYPLRHPDWVRPTYGIIDPVTRRLLEAHSVSDVTGAAGSIRMRMENHPGMMPLFFLAEDPSWPDRSFIMGTEPPKYLGYDFTLNDDPVNQIPVGREWWKACGTFAHHIASFADHWQMLREDGFYATGHNFTHSDESNLRNRVTLWWGIAVNGEATRQVAEWMQLNPVIDPTAHADVNWKVAQATVENIMRIVCSDCQGFNILRRFNRRCQPLEMLSALTSGMIVAPDFSEETWGPRSVLRNFVRASGAEKQDLWNELAQWNEKALVYFDEKIAVNLTHAP